MRLRYVILALVVGGLACASAHGDIVNRFQEPNLSASPNNYRYWGGNQLSSAGWLLPPGEVFSTEYVTNSTITQFVEGVVNVFPFQIRGNTSLVLGLYLNGSLVATEAYNASRYVSSNAQISPMGGISNNVANFPVSLIGFGVYYLHVKSPILSGTEISVTVYSNKPIWIQIDDSSKVHSYLFVRSLDVTGPPAKLVQGSVSPHTVSIGIEANA